MGANNPEAKRKYFATQQQNYLLRAKLIYELAIQHYQPENNGKCLKVVWRTKVQPTHGMSYRTFLDYVRAWDRHTGGSGNLKRFARIDDREDGDSAKMR